jgi:biotin carboxylase
VSRVLLLLPTATYRAPDFVVAAGELGVEVVVGSEHRQAMAASMEDRALVVPLHDPARAVGEIAALHERSPLDAVVAVDDQGVLVAALAGERLGFPHNPPAAVAATRDKAAMRTALAGTGVPQPAFRVLGPDDDAGAVAASLGFPCVVKPVSLSASCGVIRVDDPDAARAASARVRAILADHDHAPEGPLIVERFVPGSEVAVEALLRDGALEVLAIFDKPDPLDGPYFEETIYVTPSRLDPPVQDRIGAVVAEAAAGLGLREGPVHAELRVDHRTGAVAVLELAARSIGGLCSRALRFGAGISLEELILRHALARPADEVVRERRAAGVMMLPIPRSGVLHDVGGLDAARAVPGVAGLEITVTRGRPVRTLPEGDRYLGFLFARGTTPAEVEGILRRAHALLEVRIDDH